MRKLWKRLFGMALCLCAAACVLCVGASAEGHSHPICGDITKCTNPDHSGNHGGDVAWTEVTQNDVTNGTLTLAAGGIYYLGGDVEITNAIAITGAVELCLNGHNIVQKTDGDVITISTGGATLTLTDCRNGTVAAPYGKITTNGKGRGIVLGSMSRNSPISLTMYGGEITGNSCGNYGGGVCVSYGSTFTMYNGSITNNKGSSGGGVGIGDRGSAFVMYGGTISGNSSTSTQSYGGVNGGGGVFMYYDTSFTMHGGKITGNSSATSQYSGGNGGGVCVDSDATFIMDGGEITGNNAPQLIKYGGGVYVKGTLQISGSAKITDNFQFGTLNSETGLYEAKEGSETSNVYLSSGKNITVNAALTNDARIGVTTQSTPTSPIEIATGTGNWIKTSSFTSDIRGYVVSVSDDGTTATLGACQHTGNNNTPATCTSKAVCGACGAEYGEKDPTNHTGREEWVNTTTPQDTHEKKWNCCGLKTVTEDAHSWGSGVETRQSTCTTVGEKTYTCSVCSATKRETIDATGHTVGSPVAENRDEPTCTADGSYDEVVYCTTCSTQLSRTQKPIPASGHTIATDDAVAATCTVTGLTAGSHCSVCNTTLTAQTVIPALGHDFEGGTWQHDADKHWKKCSRCETVSGQAAHSYDDDSDTTCNDCGYVRTVTPPAPTPPTPTPSMPSAPSAPATTVPVTGSRDTVKVSASVSNGTAEVAEIEKSELEKVGTDSDVTIDLSGLDKNVTGVTLPKDTIRSISESEADGVTIKLPNAELRVDQKTLASAAEQAKGDKVQLVVETDRAAKDTMTSAQKSALDGMKNATALEAYFVSGGQRIRDFNGGEVELSIPYQASGAIRAWYLKEDGTREPVSARYDKENARLILRHFSHYVIEEVESGMGYAACAKDDTCPLSAYADLVPTAWYHDGVHYCIENGLMQGVSATSFLPNGSTTRAQLVTILWRLEGSPETAGAASFSDVADGAWYAQAVRWAADSGVVKGYENGSFGPDDAVTREQMVTILYRYAQYKGYDVSVGEDTNILSFNDALTVRGYAIPAMQWACGSGLVTGIAQDRGMLLAPKDTTTRVQAATLMMRFYTECAK